MGGFGLSLGLKNFRRRGSSGSAPTNAVLRESGSYALREDGSRFLREA
jgi:hypothetical protein